MNSTQSLKDSINLRELDRDQHPKLAGLIEKYEQELDQDELQELTVSFHSPTLL
jgi:glycine betaine/choline ABC-type transport system substrate-binding protein